MIKSFRDKESKTLDGKYPRDRNFVYNKEMMMMFKMFEIEGNQDAMVITKS